MGAAQSYRWRLPHWLMLAALVVVFDQGSKSWAVEHLSAREPIAVTSFFNLILVYNPGAAFSFLAGADGWQRWFFTVLAIAVSAWIVMTIRSHPGERRLNLALSLILGGALGNVVDRLRLGAVIDFIDVHASGWHWPAFNVADSAITVGAALLIWDQFRPRSAGRGDSP